MQRVKPTLFTVVLATFLLAQYAHAHIVLTFPPARNPKYDYLDNYRKGGPCGVPGNSFNSNLHTTIKVHCMIIGGVSSMGIRPKHGWKKRWQLLQHASYCATSMIGVHVHMKAYDFLPYIEDPNGRVTTLQAGSTFNLTYYLSFPHRVNQSQYTAVHYIKLPYLTCREGSELTY